MKFLIALLATLILGVTACAQNNALAQLGAKGVTKVGGTAAYADYLVKLDGSGRLAVAMMPGAINTTVAYAKLVYVDAATGMDAADRTGGPLAPYATLAYAIQRHGSTAGMTYALLPGSYPATVLNPVTYTGLQTSAIVGFNPYTTTIASLTSQGAGGGAPVTLTLSGVTVNTFTQGNNRAITVRLIDSAYIGSFQSSWAVAATIEHDASSNIGNSVIATITDSYLSVAMATGYTITNAGHWTLSTPLNVASALHNLAARYTTIKEDLDWTTASWTTSAAYGITAADTNRWNWGVSDWSNSVARQITGDDTNLWHWAASDWSNSVARQITADDTNRWVWTASGWSNSAARHITADDTNKWTWTASGWSNSAARQITGADTNRWNGVTNAATKAYADAQDAADRAYALALVQGMSGAGAATFQLMDKTLAPTNWVEYDEGVLYYVTVTPKPNYQWYLTTPAGATVLANSDDASEGAIYQTYLPSATVLTIPGATSYLLWGDDPGGTDHYGVGVGKFFSIYGGSDSFHGTHFGIQCFTFDDVPYVIDAFGVMHRPTGEGAWTYYTPLNNYSGDNWYDGGLLFGSAVAVADTADGIAEFEVTGSWDDPLDLRGYTVINAENPGSQLTVTANRVTTYGPDTVTNRVQVTADLYATIAQGDTNTYTRVMRYAQYGGPDVVESPEDWFVFDGAGTITDFNYTMDRHNVVIPYEIGGVPVTTIGADAFAVGGLEEELYSIRAPLSVTTIADTAFDDCWYLTTANFPGVTTLGMGAFRYCYQLTSISFPAAVTVGAQAFISTGLTSISLPSALEIGDLAFGSCSTLTSAYLPVVTIVAQYAFFSAGLTSISLPEAVVIGAHAFDGCSGLTTVSLPEALIIGEGAFQYASGIQSLEIPKVTTIGAAAFSPVNITTLRLNSVTTVGSTAFALSPLLTSVYWNCDAPADPGDVFDGSNADLTHYIVSATASGWGATYSGYPVIRLPLHGDGANVTNVNAALLGGSTKAEILHAASNITFRAIADTNLFVTLTNTNLVLYEIVYVPEMLNTNQLVLLADGINFPDNITLTLTNDYYSIQPGTFARLDDYWRGTEPGGVWTFDHNGTSAEGSWFTTENELIELQGIHTTNLAYVATNAIATFAKRADLDAYCQTNHIGNVSISGQLNVGAVNASGNVEAASYTKNGVPFTGGGSSAPLAWTPIVTVASASVATARVTTAKSVYSFTTASAVSFTNDLSALSLNCTTNYEWEAWINYTATNALATTWDNRIDWQTGTPDLTVTGLYKFAFSTACGTRIQGRQTYPTVYQKFAGLLARTAGAASGATYTYSLGNAASPASTATNYFAMSSSVSYPIIVTVVGYTAFSANKVYLGFGKGSWLAIPSTMDVKDKVVLATSSSGAYPVSAYVPARTANLEALYFGVTQELGASLFQIMYFNYKQANENEIKHATAGGIF